MDARFALVAVNRNWPKGYLITKNLSRVIKQMKNTDASLENADKIPARVHQPLDLHLSSFAVYTPRSVTSVIAIIKRYIPMNKSEIAKLETKIP